MNQEVKNKINLISEMMSIYQTTVINEKDNENIKLIKKDVTNKKFELEGIKKELNIELNKLYDNGSNEIDPEINQMRVIINEVNNLIEEVIPDILMYLQSPNLEIKTDNNIQKMTLKESIIQKHVIENKIEKTHQIEKENNTKIEPIENELQLEESKKIERNIESQKTEDIPNVNELKKTEIQKTIIEKEIKNNYTIKIKQPTQNYKNVASNIISNRIKNINSPENAIKKTYNAAEVVMNNIIQTWSE